MLKGSGGTRFSFFVFVFATLLPVVTVTKTCFFFFHHYLFFPRAHMCMRAHRVQVCVFVCTWQTKTKTNKILAVDTDRLRTESRRKLLRVVYRAPKINNVRTRRQWYSTLGGRSDPTRPRKIPFVKQKEKENVACVFFCFLVSFHFFVCFLQYVHVCAHIRTSKHDMTGLKNTQKKKWMPVKQ